MDRCSKIHAALNEEINRLLQRHGQKKSALVDIGCWDGSTTMTYADTLQANSITGVEGMEQPALAATARGIRVVKANIEIDRLPLADATADIVVCNQVLEHLKDIFHAMDEMTRLLRTGGVLVVSVPNLASFHNRLFLGVGRQPSSIRIFGPHVRGFAYRAFLEFLLTGDAYTLVQSRGVGFYPFPVNVGGNFLGNLWKSACHTPVVVLRRTENREFSFKHRYLGQGAQTLM